MTGIYFSGTGNTKHCIEKFIASLSSDKNQLGGHPAQLISIEESDCAVEALKTSQNMVVFAYPIYYSNLPKIVRDFIVENKDVWNGKKIFIICTMGLFSGDGAGVSARLFRQYNSDIIGGVHVIMPDCICDVKLLKFSPDKNRKIIEKADAKLETAARKLINGKPPQNGLSFFARLAGLFGQRLWFYNTTRHYSDKLKIHSTSCIRCGKCVGVCPMHNLTLSNGKVITAGKCTMCYRCINQCPQKAITLIGKKHTTPPAEQSTLYL